MTELFFVLFELKGSLIGSRKNVRTELLNHGLVRPTTVLKTTVPPATVVLNMRYYTIKIYNNSPLANKKPINYLYRSFLCRKLTSCCFGPCKVPFGDKLV